MYVKRFLMPDKKPLEEEGGLTDRVLRENFVTRVFVYRRLTAT